MIPWEHKVTPKWKKKTQKHIEHKDTTIDGYNTLSVEKVTTSYRKYPFWIVDVYSGSHKQHSPRNWNQGRLTLSNQRHFRYHIRHTSKKQTNKNKKRHYLQSLCTLKKIPNPKSSNTFVTTSHPTILRVTVIEVSLRTRSKRISTLWINSSRDNHNPNCVRWTTVSSWHKISGLRYLDISTRITGRLYDTVDTVYTYKRESVPTYVVSVIKLYTLKPHV